MKNLPSFDTEYLGWKLIIMGYGIFRSGKMGYRVGTLMRYLGKKNGIGILQPIPYH